MQLLQICDGIEDGLLDDDVHCPKSQQVNFFYLKPHPTTMMSDLSNRVNIVRCDVRNLGEALTAPC